MLGQHISATYIVSVICYRIYPDISEVYPRPGHTLSRYDLSLLIPIRTYTLCLLCLVLQNTHGYSFIVSALYTSTQAYWTMLIHTVLVIEVGTSWTTLSPYTLLQQYTGTTCLIYLQLCKAHQIIQLRTIRTWHIVSGMYRLGFVHLTCTGTCQHCSIVIVELLVVIPALVVYELAAIAYILHQGNPLRILGPGSAVLYAQYTVFRVLIARIQGPDDMSVAFGIYAGIYFRKWNAHLNQTSSVLQNQGSLHMPKHYCILSSVFLDATKARHQAFAWAARLLYTACLSESSMDNPALECCILFLAYLYVTIDMRYATAPCMRACLYGNVATVNCLASVGGVQFH